MNNFISYQQFENLMILNQCASLKYNPKFKNNSKKKTLLKKYREDLINRGIDMDKTDAKIFEKIAIGGKTFTTDIHT